MHGVLSFCFCATTYYCLRTSQHEASQHYSIMPTYYAHESVPMSHFIKCPGPPMRAEATGSEDSPRDRRANRGYTSVVLLSRRPPWAGFALAEAHRAWQTNSVTGVVLGTGNRRAKTREDTCRAHTQLRMIQLGKTTVQYMLCRMKMLFYRCPHICQHIFRHALCRIYHATCSMVGARTTDHAIPRYTLHTPRPRQRACGRVCVRTSPSPCVI